MQLRSGSQRPWLATEYLELHFQRSQLTHYNGIKCENIYSIGKGNKNDTGEAPWIKARANRPPVSDTANISNLF